MQKSRRPPFLDEELSDDLLLEQIRRKKDLGFLGDGTVEAIEGLGDDLSGKRKMLLELWPRVLTDAIFALKKSDSREYRSGTGLDARSLFDQASLGVKELRALLEAFQGFEPMLYGATEERYRDHVAHPFRVWMLGHLLLDECLKWRLAADEPLGPAIKAREWKCMWAITALCHDIGYPLEGIEAINRKARGTLRDLGLRPLGDLRFGFSQQMLPFHDTMIRLVASKLVRPKGRRTFLTHLQNKYYLKYLKSFDDLRHGIVSALLVSKSLVYFLESDLCRDALKPLKREDARQFLIRREILRAIASHTCLDVYHLRFDTLPFVLYLVDEMQVWGRPTLPEAMQDEQGEQRTVLHEFSGTAASVEFTVPRHAWPSGEEQKGGRLARKLNDLHRVVRLAVDTPHAAKLDLHVEYHCREDGKSASFHLKDGKIEKEPRRWFDRGEEE